MIAGAGLAISRMNDMPQNTIAAATMPDYRPVPVIVGDSLPLDIQLDLDKKASKSRATFKDSINIIDSVRYITKVKWKTRYRRGPHISHDGTGNEMAAVNPDSLSRMPANHDMVDRTENTTDTIGASKASIILTVDGKEVYKR